MLLTFSCVVFSVRKVMNESQIMSKSQLMMAVLYCYIYFLHRANGPSSFMTCLIASFTYCFVPSGWL